MPTYIVARRTSGRDDAKRGWPVSARGHRVTIPVIMTVKHRRGCWAPHIGAKESAKFIARQQAKELKCAATS